MKLFTSHRAACVCLLLIGMYGHALAQSGSEAHPDGPWAFAYFKSNGETGLHLAVSEDGLNWAEANGGAPVYNAVAGSQLLMRDPCAIQGPDGTFHLVWTTGWSGKDIGHATSADMIRWSEPQVIPVMADFPTAANTWAPEVTWDPEKSEFRIYWASRVRDESAAPAPIAAQADAATTQGARRGGRGGGGVPQRIFSTTTKDWKTFEPTKVFYSADFSVIDSTIQKSGDKWVMILKDENNTARDQADHKNLRVATADHAGGPWSGPSASITGNYWAEGPTLFKKGDKWIALFDKYTEKKYGGVETADFGNWTDISEQIEFPSGMRHGSVVPVSQEQLAKLKELTANPVVAKPADPRAGR